MSIEIPQKLKPVEQEIYNIIKKGGEMQTMEIIIRSNYHHPDIFIALRKLIALGLVEKRREGRNVYYKAIK